jgi:hypothetical protein
VCPFCPGKVESITPRFPEQVVPGGRMRRGDAVLFPNLFPYDDISAVAVICSEHFHPMDAVPERLVCDGVGLARDFFLHARDRVEDGSCFGLATWNYMPPAGGTQVHPHMQVVLTANPGNAVTRELGAESSFLARHGACYAQALLRAEQARGERFIASTGRSRGWCRSCPSVVGDCVHGSWDARRRTSDAEIADFAADSPALRGFPGRACGFNRTFPGRFGANDGRITSARLLPRLLNRNPRH